MVGVTAQTSIASAFRRAGSASHSGGSLRTAASSDNAVRRPANGLNDGPAVAIAGRTASTSSGRTRSGASSARNLSRSAAVGRWPSNIRNQTSSSVFDLARSIAEYSR